MKSSRSTIPLPSSKISTRKSLVRHIFIFLCPNNLILAFIAVSTDSKASLFAWATQPRKEGDPGPSLALPLIANRNMSISRDYGALLEDERIALHGLFIIDPMGILRQMTVNNLPAGCSVDETIRLIKAFQFTVHRSLIVFHFSVHTNEIVPCRTSTARSAPRTGPRVARRSRRTWQCQA